MRRVTAWALASLLATACDGEQPGVPLPTPAPTSTPAPTPTPSVSYARYAELTGDQQFKTACAGFRFEGSVLGRPASRFGDGFALTYAASTDTHAVPPFIFVSADIASSTPPVERRYVKGTTTLTIEQPFASGAGLDYTRSHFLTFLSSAWMHYYWCAFGVPMTQDDRLPAIVFAYSAAVDGQGYTSLDANDSFDISASIASVTVNPLSGRVILNLQLNGVPLGGGGTVPLGTFEAIAPIDPAKPSFDATFTSTDRQIDQSSLGGWFFGPQGKEIAMVFQISATDPATGRRRVFAGTVVGVRI